MRPEEKAAWAAPSDDRLRRALTERHAAVDAHDEHVKTLKASSVKATAFRSCTRRLPHGSSGVKAVSHSDLDEREHALASG
jgi:hypothetical protein